MCAIAVEATRVTLIQLLLSPSAASSSPNAPPVAPAIATGMSPLKSLFFFAPTCLAFNLVALVVLEGMPALRAIPQLGAWTILSNSGLTLALNLSAVMLIGLSAMVLGLSKVVKDVLMVVLPVLLMGESVRFIPRRLSSPIVERPDPTYPPSSSPCSRLSATRSQHRAWFSTSLVRRRAP